MNLQELIDERINGLDKLYDELLTKREELNTKGEELEKLEIFKSLKNNHSVFINTDHEELIDILSKYEDVNSKAMKEALRIIKVVLIGKNKNHLNIDLTKGQKLYYDYVISMLEDLYYKLDQEINEYLVSVDNIESVETLKNKLKSLNEKIINNNELLNEDDFNLIKEIIEDDSLSFEYKSKLLIEFRKYNIDLFNKKEDELVNPDTLDNIINCFKEYDIDKEIFNLINQNEKLILRHTNSKRIKKILDYFKENDILKNFSVSDLLCICIYGNINSVSKTYEKLISEDKNYKIFYEIPSIWVNKERKNKKDKEESDRSISNTMYLASLGPTLEDMLENEKFLKEKGYDISFTNSRNSYAKALRMPHEDLVNAYNTLVSYKIIDVSRNEKLKSLNVLTISSLEEKLNKCIELGLLNIPSFPNYVKEDLSFLNFSKLFPLINYLKLNLTQNEYYKSIFSQFGGVRSGQLKTDITKFSFNKGKHFPSIPDISKYKNAKEFVKEKYVDVSKLISNTNTFEKEMNNNNRQINSNIFNLEEIINLENNYKINDYAYNFDGIFISRLKVLKNYSALINSGLQNEEDALLYSVVRNSYLDQNSFDLIKDIILERSL